MNPNFQPGRRHLPHSHEHLQSERGRRVDWSVGNIIVLTNLCAHLFDTHDTLMEESNFLSAAVPLGGRRRERESLEKFHQISNFILGASSTLPSNVTNPGVDSGKSWAAKTQ